MSSEIFSTEVGDFSDGSAAPTIVFLHGLFGQGRNFTQIAKALTPEFRSVLVDLPNHGRSARTGTADYLDVADLVAVWLRGGYAASGPVHVVGHSMGGKVAMVLALRHPDVVDRLVVADISPTKSAGAGEFEHLLGALAEVDLATLKRRGDAEVFLRDKIPQDVTRKFLLTNLQSGDDGFTWLPDLALLRRELPTIGGFPDLDATFDHSVLWIAGEKSNYVRAEDGPVMRRLFPRTRRAHHQGRRTLGARRAAGRVHRCTAGLPVGIVSSRADRVWRQWKRSRGDS